MSITETIKAKLEAALAPVELIIQNDSARHAGHAGDNGTGESHFKLKVVSKKFEGLSRVARQKLIYQALESELKSGVHALSLKALTPQENNKF